jgi:riboflavin kinase/FMN adenylyltransferase
MEVYRDAWGRADLPRGTVLAVGNFDGIHLGQRAILERVVARARELGVAAAVVTFTPHPKNVLRPDDPVLRLTTEAQMEELVAACGIDALVRVRFTPSFAAMSAERFVREFLVGRLGVVEILVGSRFTFGRDRAGDLPLLAELGTELGFRAVGVEEVLLDGEAISSTRIRRTIVAGAVDEVRDLLGRPYAVAGEVTHGDARGRELGWPTANLAARSDLLPRDGVYAAALAWEGSGGPRPGVANVGVRPTVVGPHERVAEIHLFDFQGDLYGRSVSLLFCRRLREERRFAGLDELCEQIGRDAAEAREYFATHRCWNHEAGAPDERPNAST